jgi:diguanylate cyclase (GGDEF)-like protein
LRLPGLERNAHRERLTDLYNARHLTEMLELEPARAHRLDYPTTVVVATVGEVHHLLQRYGRATVDFLAIAVVERLAGAVRDYDVVARLQREASTTAAEHRSKGGLLNCASRPRRAAGQAVRFADDPRAGQISASAALATIIGDGVVGHAALAEVERAAERSQLSGPGH